MTFRIDKRVGIRATSDRIWAVISELEGWSRWNPVETNASGTIAYGGPIRLTETIPGLPQRQVAAVVGDWQPYAKVVWAEKRGWQFTSTRFFEIEQLEDPGSCIVANGFIFAGLRGEGFHDKHRYAIRTACEQIGEALKRAAEAQG